MVSHHGEQTFHDAGGYGIATRQVVMGELASWQRRCFGVWCDAKLEVTGMEKILHRIEAERGFCTGN